MEVRLLIRYLVILFVAIGSGCASNCTVRENVVGFTGCAIYKPPLGYGESHEGQFVNGKLQRLATSSFTNGTVYKGPYSNGKRHGMGQCKTPDSEEFRPCLYSNNALAPRSCYTKPEQNDEYLAEKWEMICSEYRQFLE